MLSPPLLPCQHRIMPDVQITSTSDQYKVMQQLQKQFSGGAAPQFIHVSTGHGDYQPWHKDVAVPGEHKSAYIGKVNSAYLIGPTGGQRNICFPGSMIHETPLKTMEDSRKLHCGVIGHNRTPGPAGTCKSYYPQPQLPVSVDIPSHFMTPSSMSVSPTCSPQRTLQTNFTGPAHGCGINSRLYEVPAPIETAELSLWSMRSHRYQPYAHHLPPRSSFSHTRGSPYTQHLLPAGPEQTSPFSPVNQCNFVPGFPAGTSVHHAALLAFGDRLNASSTITRRCARCRCPNCLSPTELRNANGKKEHICHFPNCGKVYGKTSHLKAHIRWHLGERPFVCNWLFCGKSFTRSDELQRHLRTHTGEKKFQCQICDKKFMRSDHLSKHIKIHKKKNLSVTERKDAKDSSSSEEELHGKLNESSP